MPSEVQVCLMKSGVLFLNRLAAVFHSGGFFLSAPFCTASLPPKLALAEWSTQGDSLPP